MNKLSSKTVGKICLGIGGIFALGGLILFILSNWINLSSQKATATILDKYNIETDDGQKFCILDLTYRVGEEFVYTTYECPYVLEDDVFELDIYYKIKDPKQVVEAGWNFSSLFVVLFGLVILSFGLYLTEIFTFGIPERIKPNENSTEYDKKIYAARERVENSLLPGTGSLALCIFGVVLIILKYGWWSWIFAIGGAVITIYMLLDLIPAIGEYTRLRSSKKIKATVVDDIELDESADNEDEE